LAIVATEFLVQGLELDYAGLCWDLDLMRSPGHTGWVARKFSGTAWQVMRQQQAIANQLNSYRVLLTRARYETVIFVPNGSHSNPTRLPNAYDAIAGELTYCGVRPLPVLVLAHSEMPSLPLLA
jgi:hypothetical protein